MLGWVIAFLFLIKFPLGHMWSLYHPLRTVRLFFSFFPFSFYFFWGLRRGGGLYSIKHMVVWMQYKDSCLRRPTHTSPHLYAICWWYRWRGRVEVLRGPYSLGAKQGFASGKYCNYRRVGVFYLRQQWSSSNSTSIFLVTKKKKVKKPSILLL